MQVTLSEERKVAHFANSAEPLPSALASGSLQQEREPSPKPRGFAKLAPEKHREIAQLGGLAAHASGVAHRFTADEAREAGRKGGAAVSGDREHMARIGRLGGQRRRRNHS